MKFSDPRRCDDCGKTKVCARVALLGVPLFLCAECVKELGPMDVDRLEIRERKRA